MAEVDHVVILLHGIRTRAEWMKLVKPVLEGPQRQVFNVQYGRIDLFSFLLPIPLLRRPAEKRVWREIDRLREKHAGAQLSVVAHSFGTYLITRILKTRPNIRIHQLILCGSIVPESYRWDWQHSPRVERATNDCGTKDIFPVLAKFFSVGYGASGRFGFGSVDVNDRHWPVGHSDCLNDAFARDNWLPLLRDEVGPQGRGGGEKAPLWLSLLGSGVAKLVIAVAVAAVVAMATKLPEKVVVWAANAFQTQAQDLYAREAELFIEGSDQAHNAYRNRYYAAIQTKDATELEKLADELNWYANSLSSQQDYDQFTLAILRDRNAALIHALRGLTLTELKRANEAAEAYKLALESANKTRGSYAAARIRYPNPVYSQILDWARPKEIEPTLYFTEAEAAASLAKAVPAGSQEREAYKRRARNAYDDLTRELAKIPAPRRKSYTPDAGSGLEWLLREDSND